jgi:metal-responsive CopG/Arc/MetJ family transcriptional regulator
MLMTKILVSIDDRLLARIDREARQRGLTRSAYLSRLAAQELDAREGPGRAAHVRRALDRLDRLFAAQETPEDATRAIRSERDAR